jgi:hypothetical protein
MDVYVAGCDTEADLTTNYTTATVYANDSTCSVEASKLRLMTCANTPGAVDETYYNNLYCNDEPLYC